jgi:hypothetical protein
VTDWPGYVVEFDTIRGVPSLTVGTGSANVTAPSARDSVLMEVVHEVDLDDELRVIANEARLVTGVRPGSSDAPLAVVVAGALRPWAAHAMDDGLVLPPWCETPKELRPIAGAASLREAAGRLTGRPSSRLVVRALAERTAGASAVVPLDLAAVSVSVARLGAELGLADEQVARLLSSPPLEREGRPFPAETLPLDNRERRLLRLSLAGSDPRVVARLLADALTSPDAWDDLLEAVALADHPSLTTTPARGSVSRWLDALVRQDVAAHGDTAVMGVPGASALDGAATPAGRTVRLAHTARDVVRAGHQFRNCLRDDPRPYVERQLQVFTVHDPNGDGVAVGHLELGPDDLVRLHTVLGSENERPPDDLVDDLRHLITRLVPTALRRAGIRVEHAAGVALLADLHRQVAAGLPIPGAIQAYADAVDDGTIAIDDDQKLRLHACRVPGTGRIGLDATLHDLQLPGFPDEWPIAAAALLWAAGHPAISQVPDGRGDLDLLRQTVMRAINRTPVEELTPVSLGQIRRVVEGRAATTKPYVFVVIPTLSPHAALR